MTPSNKNVQESKRMSMITNSRRLLNIYGMTYHVQQFKITIYPCGDTGMSSNSNCTAIDRRSNHIAAFIFPLFFCSLG